MDKNIHCQLSPRYTRYMPGVKQPQPVSAPLVPANKFRPFADNHAHHGAEAFGPQACKVRLSCSGSLSDQGERFMAAPQAAISAAIF